MTPEQRRQTLITVAVVAAGLLVAWASLGIIRNIRWILEACVAALFISFASEGAVERLEDRGWRRDLAAGTVMTGLVVTFAGALWVLLPAVGRAGSLLVNNLNQVAEELAALATRFGLSQETVVEAVGTAAEAGRAWLSQTSSTGEVVAAAGMIMAQIATTLFLLYYLLAQGHTLRNGVVRLVGDEKRRALIARTWDLALEKTSGFFAGNFILAVIAGVFMTIVAVTLRIPTPVGLGAWVLLASLVPMLGGWLAAVMPVLITLTDDLLGGEGFGRTIIVCVALGLFQAVDNYVMRPRIMSKSVNIPPVLAFLAVVAGASIGGLIGAVLSVPVAAIGYTFASEWIAAKPELEPKLEKRVADRRRPR